MGEGNGSLAQTAGNAAGVSPAPVSSGEASPPMSGQRMASAREWDESDHVFPRWPWSLPIRAIRVAFLELVMRPLIWVLAAPRVVRQTAEPPLSPVLVISNHVTAYDGALILYALPGRLRRRVAIAMSGKCCWTSEGSKSGEDSAKPASTGCVLAGDYIIQCISSAQTAWVPEELCACR